ncbi:type I-E CRISPR-associated endoribonuclease Cas2 [Corynebacterium striatum]|nr:type I-E CRISPR-associated endoribonuclease Cas2 [Corynebacterium striatum]
MMVLVVTACPAGLRGDLTKWLLEISPGVFVGRPSGRIRDLLWERCVSLCKDGRAILVFSCDNEQGLDFRVHRHEWEPVDFDGVTLMRRTTAPSKAQRRTGWSAARNARRH